MLSIGEFALASGLTAKALRLYDELNLLRPAEVDQGNGYRYYAPEQVEQARFIARLRSAEVPLVRIAAILGASTPEAAADEVLTYWREVEADRASAREVITSLVALLRGQDNAMKPSTTSNIDLADVIAHVDDELADAGDLAKVSEAQRRAQALTDLGNRLVDHFVSEAKLRGASWTQISDVLGSTTQPDRQHTSKAFSRFTDLSRHSIVLAQEAARTHQHDLIGTEHLLLGLLSEPRGVAYEVLVARTGSERDVRAVVEGAMPPSGESTLPGHIAFGPDSTLAIEQALRAASDLGHDWVGTEHLLLGLIRTADSSAALILRNLGFTSEGLHDTVAAAVTDRLAILDREAGSDGRDPSPR